MEVPGEQREIQSAQEAFVAFAHTWRELHGSMDQFSQEAISLRDMNAQVDTHCSTLRPYLDAYIGDDARTAHDLGTTDLQEVYTAVVCLYQGFFMKRAQENGFDITEYEFIDPEDMQDTLEEFIAAIIDGCEDEDPQATKEAVLENTVAIFRGLLASNFEVFARHFSQKRAFTRQRLIGSHTVGNVGLTTFSYNMSREYASYSIEEAIN